MSRAWQIVIIINTNCIEFQEKVSSLGFTTVRYEVDALLALKSHGLTTGLVIQSGQDVTSTVVIVNGQIQRDSIRFTQVAGSMVTQHFTALLTQVDAEYNLFEAMKRRLCYVALEFEAELKKDYSKIQTVLMDGYTRIDQERFKAPEILFKPALIKRHEHGVHELAHASLERAESGLHRELLQNVVVAGGSTLFPGYPERLKKELESLTRKYVSIHAPFNRKYSVWKGGSMMATDL